MWSKKGTATFESDSSCRSLRELRFNKILGGGFMFKKFRIGVVASIILALVSPAAPASNAEGEDAGFGIQSTGFSASVIDDSTNLPTEGSIRLEIYTGPQDTQFVDGYSPYHTPELTQPYNFSALEDGDYLVVASNWAGEKPAGTDSMHVDSRFDLTISGGAITAFHVEGQPSEAVVLDPNNGYELITYPANFYFEVKNIDGSPFLASESQWVNAELQALEDSNWVGQGYLDAYWILDESDQAIATGLKGRALDATKTYRVKVMPDRVSGAAETISPTFTITSVDQAAAKLADVQFDTPGMEVKVVTPGSTAGISESSVRIFTEPQCCKDFGSSDGDVPISVVFEEAGTFEMEVSTNNGAYSDFASKKYSVVVSDVDGKLTGVVSGATPDANGVYLLELSSANLSIQVVQPTDSSTAINGAQVNIFEYVGGERRDHVNSGWSQNGSVVSFRVSDGSYLLEVRPENGDYLLASKTYLLTVSGSGSTVLVQTNESIPQTVSPTSDGYLLAAAQSNLVGTVVDAYGVALVTNWDQRKWVSIDLLKDNDEYYAWAGNTNVDDQGRFSFNVTEDGDYRIEVRPQGYADSANLSFDFSLTSGDLASTTTLEYPAASGKVYLPEPDVRIAVRIPGGSENLKYVQVEVFKDNEYITNTNTAAGVAALTFPSAGTYQIKVNPPRSATGTARATYEATLTLSPRGVTIAGLTAVDGVYILELGVPTLSGTLRSPDGSTIRDTEVVPVDRDTGQDMWEYAARTNAFGVWSIALPEGSWDIFARAPWGDATLGDSDRIGPVVVNSSGVATSIPAGYTKDAFDISLNLPTWTGTLVSPNDSSQILTNGNICLATGSYENRTWSCAQTNGQGEWALSKPTGFTGFGDDDELFINEWGSQEFAEKRLRGGAEIESALGVWVNGSTYAGVLLSPAAPNLTIFVQAGVDGNGDPAPAKNAWVGVDDGMDWLGGGNTNSQGFATIAIPDDKLTSELNVQVNIEHNATLSADFAAVRKVFAADGSASAPRALSVALATPNFKVQVSEPSPSSAAVSYGWIEVMNEITGEWIGGSNTNNSGFSAISLPASATYTVTVNPPWDGGATYSKNTYTVVVDSSDNVTSVQDRAGNPVNPDGGTGIFGLSLATPSVSGVVKDSSSNAVRDAWVTPIEQNGWEYLWWMGANSRSGGAFSMNLDDGIFLLEANPSWNNSAGDTKSKRCSVEIVSGTLNAGYSGTDKCTITDSKVQLALRAPNVSFTLKAPDSTGVAYANVGMFIGDWSVWSQSNRYGEVSLNLDADEIKERSGVTTAGTHDIRIVVDPPYGNSDLARFECNSTDAGQLCRDIPDFVLDGSLNASFSAALTTGFEASFAAPNTRIQIADPSGSPLLQQGSWVTILEENGGNREWLVGSNSDGSGIAAFNLDISDPTQTYTIEVSPPHTRRGEFAQATYTGLTQAELNSYLAKLESPNLKLKVVDSNRSLAAKWAWVGVEIVDPTNNNAFLGWHAGSGADREGVVSLNLPSSKRYRVMFNPNPGTAGSFTSCLFDVDGSGVVTKVSGSCVGAQRFIENQWVIVSGPGYARFNAGDDRWEVSLSAGNVVGRAYYVASDSSEVNLGGAIVVATSGNLEVTTTSKSDGTYALQLDEGLTWAIETFYVTKVDDPTFATSTNKLTLSSVAASSSQQTRDSLFVR